MEISKMSTKEIFSELNKRSEVENKPETGLIFGTIGVEGNLNFVEIFNQIREPKDLDLLPQLSLRARFNSHRRYRGFYFKSSDFDKLEKSLNHDNESFANWVLENKSVKYINL